MVAPGAPQISKVVWSGSLFVPAEGLYQFRIESTANNVVVLIGAEVVATRDARTASRNLAAGLHAVTVATSVDEAVHFRLFWQRPGESETVIPPSAFFRRPAHGLLAEYETVGGRHRRVEPFPFYVFFAPPFPGVYSARWSGRLEVPKPGNYRLSVESDRAVRLEVDGQRLSDDARLAAGSHDLTVGIDGIEGAPRLRLYWQLPDRERELIPPEAYDPG
jgi:hypothetical protein